MSYQAYCTLNITTEILKPNDKYMCNLNFIALHFAGYEPDNKNCNSVIREFTLNK